MSISERIFKSLETGTDVLTEINGLKYLPYRMMWGSSLQGYSRDSVQAVLSRSIKQGFVNKRIDQGKVYLALTELGEDFLKRRKERARLTLNTTGNKWDGLYRFILFDIPEKERVIRDTLRGALKSAGAVCWQRSVWVTRENITLELNSFIQENGLDDYCTILEVKDIYSLKLKKLLDQQDKN